MGITVSKSNRTEYGVLRLADKYIFTVALDSKENTGLRIFSNDGKKITEIALDEYKLAGNVYSLCVKGLPEDGFQYEYVTDSEVVNDPYMKAHSLKRTYGAEINNAENDRAVYLDSAYDWEDDKQLKLDYSEIVSYQLHVRGFTKHSSSKVKANGCFLGITEKIPYLCDLGINQIELMPAYEFYEIDSEIDKLGKNHPSFESEITIDNNGNKVKNEPLKKINYWGYKKGHYFIPKYNYSFSNNPQVEYKDMVKALHKAGIEVIMQMYFTKNESESFILDVLHYWNLEYHVDGFHLMGENIPVHMIVNDPLLSDSKIYINNYDRNNELLNTTSSRFTADINNGFMTSIRSYLKSDGNSLNGFVNFSRLNYNSPRNINYITCYEGFTLNDLVSYEHKHNEANGENNTDGTDYNLSWNCGAEGKSTKKAIKELRIKQIKNALSMLILSQGTPMLFMGDEMMNTQDGNNNPYCQDNEITWLNWKTNKSKEEIHDYTKKLIQLRRNHKVFHQDKELKGMDYISSGVPDISYHQDMAWKTDFNSYLLHLGVMLSGNYTKVDDKPDDTFYIAYNMHWENHLFGLPRLKDMKWEYVIGTCSDDEKIEIEKDLSGSQDNICIYKRSIILLKAVKDERAKVKKTAGKKNKKTDKEEK